MLRAFTSLLFGLVAVACAVFFSVALHGFVYPNPPLPAYYGIHDPRSSGAMFYLSLALLLGLVVWSGVYAFNSARKGQKNMIWRSVIISVLLASSGITLTYVMYRNDVSREDAIESQSSSQSDQLQIVSSTQDAGGLTEDLLNREFLKFVETQAIASMKEKMRMYLSSLGYADERINIESDAIYVDSGGRRFGVIRFRSTGVHPANTVIIFGLVGTELRRVTCVNKSIESISIIHGDCADAVEDTFRQHIGHSVKAPLRQPSIWATCAANSQVMAELVGDAPRAQSFLNQANEYIEVHGVKNLELAAEKVRINKEFHRGEKSWEQLGNLALGCLSEHRKGKAKT